MKTITKHQYQQIIKFIRNNEIDDVGISIALFNEIPSRVQLDISESKQEKFLAVLKENFNLKLISRQVNYSDRKREYESEILVDMKNGITVRSSKYSYLYLSYCNIKTPETVLDKYIKLSMSSQRGKSRETGFLF